MDSLRPYTDDAAGLPDGEPADAVPAALPAPISEPGGGAGTGYAETGQEDTAVPFGTGRVAGAAETVPDTDFEQFTYGGVVIAPGREITAPY